MVKNNIGNNYSMQNRIRTYEKTKENARNMNAADPEIYKWINTLHTSRNDYMSTIKGLDIRKLGNASVNQSMDFKLPPLV